MIENASFITYTDLSQVQRTLESSALSSFLSEMHVRAPEELKETLSAAFQGGSDNRSCFYMNYRYGEFASPNYRSKAQMAVFGVKELTPGITRRSVFTRIFVCRGEDLEDDPFRDVIFGKKYDHAEEFTGMTEAGVRAELEKDSEQKTLRLDERLLNRAAGIVERLWAELEKNPRTRFIVRLDQAEIKSMQLLAGVYELIPDILRRVVGFETNITEEDLAQIEKCGLPIYLLTAEKDEAIDPSKFSFPVVFYDPDYSDRYATDGVRLGLLKNLAKDIAKGSRKRLDEAEVAVMARTDSSVPTFKNFEDILWTAISEGPIEEEKPNETQQSGGAEEVVDKPEETEGFLDEDDWTEADSDADWVEPGEEESVIWVEPDGEVAEEIGISDTESVIGPEAEFEPQDVFENGEVTDAVYRDVTADAQEPEISPADTFGNWEEPDQGTVPTEVEASDSWLESDGDAETAHWQEAAGVEETNLRQEGTGSGEDDHWDEQAAPPKEKPAQKEKPAKRVPLKEEVASLKKKNSSLMEKIKKLRKICMALAGAAALLLIACIVLGGMLIAKSRQNKETADNPSGKIVAESTEAAAETNQESSKEIPGSGNAGQTAEESAAENGESGQAASEAGNPEESGEEAGSESSAGEAAESQSEASESQPAGAEGTYREDWDIVQNASETGIHYVDHSDRLGSSKPEWDIYFHIMFADDNTGSGISQESSRPYLGAYLSTREADNTDPQWYNWQEIMTLDPKEGIKGTWYDNRDIAYYLHFAYADDSTANGFSIDEKEGKRYLGYYIDDTRADSTDPAMYTWIERTAAN